MFSIRGLRESDSDCVREVCALTAAKELADTDKKRLILWNLYCDYYFRFARETSFVATDERDRAIGYVFCAPDYAEYEAAYRKELLPALKKLSSLKAFIKRINLRGDRRFMLGMPAHLHIDIKEEYQRQGIGHKLVDALVIRLHEQGVPAVGLTASASNVKGVNFYTKYGFERLKSIGGSIVFKLDISSKYKEIAMRGEYEQ